MKNIQFIILVLLIIITTGSTHYILSQKIWDKVKDSILEIEYEKVWGKENYEKIVKITKKQTIEGLKQYDSENSETKDSDKKEEVETGVEEGHEGHDHTKNPDEQPQTAKKISLEQAKKITKENTYVLWNPDAEISWVEYSDMNCPFCKKLHDSGATKEILKQYDWKVNVIFKQFAIFAPMKAAANLCAWKIGWVEKYYAFIDKSFENKYKTKDEAVKIATDLGLDKKEFETCIDSDEIKKLAESQMEEGRSLFWITWTPWNVFINNKTGEWDVLPWAYPFENFKEKVDTLLK